MLLPTAMHCGALATHVYWTLQTNGHEQGMSNHQTKPNDQKRAPSFPPSLLSLLFALHLNAFACSNGLGNLIPHPCHNHLRHAKKKKKRKSGCCLLGWRREMGSFLFWVPHWQGLSFLGRFQLNSVFGSTMCNSIEMKQGCVHSLSLFLFLFFRFQLTYRRSSHHRFITQVKHHG